MHEVADTDLCPAESVVLHPESVTVPEDRMPWAVTPCVPVRNTPPTPRVPSTESLIVPPMETSVPLILTLPFVPAKRSWAVTAPVAYAAIDPDVESLCN